MRHLLVFAILLGLGACALFEPSGRRFVVFYEPSSAQLDDTAKTVLAAVAEWAKGRPAMPVVVASYADTYGSPQANADFTRLRAQGVIAVLVSNGVPAARIQRRDVGSVGFQIDSQESRRVVVTVGSP